MDALETALGLLETAEMQYERSEAQDGNAYWRSRSERSYAEPDHRCHDCGIAPGGFHHPGCDIEICPRCKGQLISCDCEVEG